MKNPYLLFLFALVILNPWLRGQDTTIYYPNSEMLLFRGNFTKIALLDLALPPRLPWPNRPVLGRSKPILQITAPPEKKQVYKDLTRKPKEDKNNYEQRVEARYQHRLEQWEKHRQSELDRMQKYLDDSLAFAQENAIYQKQLFDCEEQAKAEQLVLQAWIRNLHTVSMAREFVNAWLVVHKTHALLDASPYQTHWTHLREQSILAGFDAKDYEAKLASMFKDYQQIVKTFEAIETKLPTKPVFNKDLEDLITWIRTIPPHFKPEHHTDSLIDSLQRLRFLLQPQITNIDAFFQSAWLAYLQYLGNQQVFQRWSQDFRELLWAWEQALYENAWILPVWHWFNLLPPSEPVFDFQTNRPILSPIRRAILSFAQLGTQHSLQLVFSLTSWIDAEQNGSSYLFFFRINDPGQTKPASNHLSYGAKQTLTAMLADCQKELNNFGLPSTKRILFRLAFADAQGVWAYRLEGGKNLELSKLNLEELKPLKLEAQEDLLNFFGD